MGQESMYAYTRVGTPYYMSPEQINAKKYNDKSDIWSLGCIIYELAALKPPFTADNQLALAMKIKSGKIENLPDDYSKDLQKTIEKMLHIDQEKRPSIEELVQHPQKEG
jgi:serine/threonine protein kinase